MLNSIIYFSEFETPYRKRPPTHYVNRQLNTIHKETKNLRTNLNLQINESLIK